MGERIEGRAALRHLSQRAGFGPGPADAGSGGRSYEEEVEARLVALDEPPPPDPEGFEPYRPLAIQQAWLDRMVSGKAPLAERLAFFWHGHFATSDAKVQDPALLWRQYRLFRERGAGRFRDLLLAVGRDVAMIRFLDGNSNRRGHPNENYAREVQELFTLGIGRYTERDVREVARAFTGWGSEHHEFVFRDEFHDHGAKTIHGHEGDLGGEEVAAILADHPACGRLVCSKLLRHFSHADPAPEEVEDLAGVFRRTDGDVKAVLRALFLAPAFRDASRRLALVRGPVEVLAAALRATGAAAFPRDLHGSLERMGQVLFRPPSVKGWTSGPAWLTSAGVVERLRAARRLADGAAPEALPLAVETAFDGPPPAAVTRASGRDRVALALASPEFQLS